MLPTWKLLLVGNYQPSLHSVDAALVRRFNILPFVHKPLNPDRELEAKLRSEWPSILRWAIEGCLDWQRNGLLRPAVALEATASYLENQDVVGAWITGRCDVGPECSDTVQRLFESYAIFAKANGAQPGTSTTFGDGLVQRAYQRIKDTDGIRGRGFRGLRVRAISA